MIRSEPKIIATQATLESGQLRSRQRSQACVNGRSAAVFIGQETGSRKRKRILGSLTALFLTDIEDHNAGWHPSSGGQGTAPFPARPGPLSVQSVWARPR